MKASPIHKECNSKTSGSKVKCLVITFHACLIICSVAFQSLDVKNIRLFSEGFAMLTRLPTRSKARYGDGGTRSKGRYRSIIISMFIL